MSVTKQLTSLAAGLAAGSYTNDYVLEQLGGDKSLFDRVLGMAAGLGVGSVASSVTKSILDSDIVDDSPIGDIIDSVDDFIGDIFD